MSNKTRETPEEATTLTRLQRGLTKKLFLHDNDNDKVLITFSAGLTQLQPGDDQTKIIKRPDSPAQRCPPLK